MSGSGNINHPLREEPGLKTKRVNHHSSEYSSPATHVLQGCWGNVCVTRCMCEYSREHSRVYVQQGTSYLQQAVGIIQYWEGTPHLVLYNIVIQKFPRKISFCLQEIFEPKISSALGVFELFFPEQVFGEQIFREKILVRNVFFPKKIFGPSSQIILEKKSSYKKRP